MSTVAGIHLGRAGITPLESVLASLEQYVLFVQGKSCLSPLTLLCLLSSSPDWVSEWNAEWNSS